MKTEWRWNQLPAAPSIATVAFLQGIHLGNLATFKDNCAVHSDFIQTTMSSTPRVNQACMATPLVMDNTATWEALIHMYWTVTGFRHMGPHYCTEPPGGCILVILLVYEAAGRPETLLPPTRPFQNDEHWLRAERQSRLCINCPSAWILHVSLLQVSSSCHEQSTSVTL